MMTHRGNCKGINAKTNLPCKKTDVLSDDLCLYHSPSYKSRLREIARKGGQVRLKNMPKLKDLTIKSLDDLKAYLEGVLTSGAKGSIMISPKDLASLGKLYMDTTEKVDLEKRLTEIEKHQSKEN